MIFFPRRKSATISPTAKPESGGRLPFGTTQLNGSVADFAYIVVRHGLATIVAAGQVEGWMEILIRPGCEADAQAAIDVLRRSIAELCIADHKGNEQELASWLANKTEAAWITWVARADATVLVAEKADEIVGIGMMDQRGEILLNYVRPDSRFGGVSKALIEALENEARTEGIQRCFLESTATAKVFYEHRGYRPMTEHSLSLEKLL